MEVDVVGVVILLILSALGLSWFAGSDAPYIPTTKEQLSQLFKLIKIKRGQIFYELGSGDGRVVLQAAQRGAEATGIEQSLLRVYLAKYKAWRLNLKAAQFLHGNIFDRDYHSADIVFIFLLQPAVNKLENKLKQELKRGALVITQKYHFKNWRQTKKMKDFWVYTT